MPGTTRASTHTRGARVAVRWGPTQPHINRNDIKMLPSAKNISFRIYDLYRDNILFLTKLFCYSALMSTFVAASMCRTGSKGNFADQEASGSVFRVPS